MHYRNPKLCKIIQNTQSESRGFFTHIDGMVFFTHIDRVVFIDRMVFFTDSLLILHIHTELDMPRLDALEDLD